MAEHLILRVSIAKFQIFEASKQKLSKGKYQI